MAATAILRSAENTKKKIRQYEDRLAAFQWQNSAQTRSDFTQYLRYLDGRVDGVTDPNEILTYQTTIRSARRGFITNEVQRRSIEVLQGSGTDQNKLDAIVELYEMAIDNDDFNTAQNLYQQALTLNSKIEEAKIQEVERQQRVARTYARNKVAKTEDLVKKFEKGDEEVDVGDFKVKTFKMLEEEFQASGQTELGLLSEARVTFEEFQKAMIDQYESLTTQEDADKFIDKYGKVLDDIDKNGNVIKPAEWTFDVAGQKMTYSELFIYEAAEAAGNPIFSSKKVLDPVTGTSKFELQRNDVDDVVWTMTRDENGQEFYNRTALTTREDVDTGAILGTKVYTDADGTRYLVGKDGTFAGGTRKLQNHESLPTLKEVYEASGYQINYSDDSLTVIDPNGTTIEGAVLNASGVIKIADSYTDNEGNLIPTLDVIDWKQGDNLKVTPAEASDFGLQTNYIDPDTGRYFRTANSKSGDQFINNILTPVSSATQLLDESAKISRVLNGGEAEALNTRLLNGNSLQGSSYLINSANTTSAGIKEKKRREFNLQQQAIAQQQKALQQQAFQRELQSQQKASQLQSNVGLNLNQTPAGNVRKIQVAKPEPTPTLGKVVSAKPKGKVTVAKPVPTPRVSVGGGAPRIDNIDQLRF